LLCSARGSQRRGNERRNGRRESRHDTFDSDEILEQEVSVALGGDGSDVNGG
jgi:hypothetical protein